MIYYLIGVLIMAAFSYIPRFLPLTFYRKKIESPYLQSLLYYLPYAALGALTFPGIFHATPHLYESLAGATVAFYFAFRNKSLIFVAVSGMVACYVAYLIMTYIH